MLSSGALSLAPLPFVLDTAVVSGERVNSYLELVGFNQRRALGFGDHITREEFEQYFPGRVVDVLRRMPTVRVRPNPNFGGLLPFGGRDLREWVVESARAARPGCPMVVFLDGARVGDMETLDIEMLIATNQLEAVEAYGGAAQIPPIFNVTGAECGVLALWTRR
ncbi:hypothetical protein HRbin33_00299 [bacterium HR33]|nr:hypothetical protein HRbin33_00299 [bacterium HR33]